MTPRGFNWQIWAAPVLGVAALFSYPMLFVRWPITRDVPWANLLLVAGAAWMLAVGMRRAFAPGRFRAVRIVVGTALGALCVAGCSLFVYVRFVVAAALPPSSGAPQVGQRAPEFTLLDEHQNHVTLAGLLSAPIPGDATARPPKAVLVIFYMYSGCRACNSELHDIQQKLGTLAAAGVRPVAISIDTPDVSRVLSDEAGYTFTFLSDPQMDVIRLYDVADEDQGARPAEFLVDATGTVRWRYLTTNLDVRAGPSQILDAAKGLP